MNTLRKMEDIQIYEKPKDKIESQILYIEADEDHIHL